MVRVCVCVLQLHQEVHSAIPPAIRTCIWVSVVEVWCDSLQTLSPVSP